jgi:bacterioferritin
MKMNQSTNKISTASADVLSDIQTLRKRARKNIEEGAVTTGYGADRKEVTRLLNEALATELVCVLRYKRHYFMAKRITELGGEPNFSPDGLSERSHAEYVEGDTLESMIKENLIAERIAIESYREMVIYLAEHDPTTQRMLKEILAMEEEHADDLASLLVGM